MIIETCPFCGADLEQTILTSNLPKRKVMCPKCGWQHTESTETIRVPYVVSDSVYPNNCKYCGNNPENGGSGVCHCILGNPTTC